MFFPVKRPVVYLTGDTRRTKKFAWWPVRIESYGRYRGMLWLEHYDYVEECVQDYTEECVETDTPVTRWKVIGTFYPAAPSDYVD